MPARWNMKGNFWCWRASRERTGNHSLRWRKARTEWTTSALGLPDPDAGDGRPGHERVRHSRGAARGWVDLRAVLHRAEGSESAAMGHVGGGGAMRAGADKGPEELEAAAGFADEIAAAEKRGVASGICGWEIRAVYAAPG